MDASTLKNLLEKQSGKSGWQISTVDGRKWFLNSLVACPMAIIFCLVPDLNHEPCIARLSPEDLNSQCKDQGFLDDSIKLIQMNLNSQSANASLRLEFKKVGSQLEVTVPVSGTISVMLRIENLPLNSDLSLLIYRSLLQEIVFSAYGLRRYTNKLENLLHTKDRAIDYLKLSVEELGSDKLIKRWAPKDSVNAKALIKFDHSNECGYVAESLQGEDFNDEEIVETVDALFQLRKGIKNITSTSTSPRKRLRRTSSADFLPYQEPARPNKFEPKTTDVQEKESSLGAGKLDKQESLMKDSKKRKFGRVKIAKKKS